MPYVSDKGKYINPFYQEVDAKVQLELNTRADYYGRRVRGVGKSFPKNVVWSYQKTAWGHVIGEGGTTLGFPGSKVMSGPDGKLTLYSSQRNVPKKPLLTGIEISNEGTIGSLLKGKFTFTAYPILTSSGFDLGKLEEDFFTPGKEVEISWGWSVAAASHAACMQQFTGIIYNFNWSFNNDLSITADVSIVSAASITMGQSGDQSSKEPEDGAVDPQGLPIKGDNLITVIDQDLASTNLKSVNLSPGQSKYVGKGETSAKLLDYFAIGLPFQETSDPAEKNIPPPKPKTFWYVKLSSVVQFINDLIKKFEQNNPTYGNLFTVVVDRNEAAFNGDIKSTSPIRVFFPDPEMGSYGDLKPFATSIITEGPVTGGTINIGQILLGTDYIKETYKKFILDNATNVPFKNLTKLADELIKGINDASGDAYQLTANLFENKQGPSSGKPDATKGKLIPAILSIEDSNLAKAHTDVKPYKFDATIFKPLIKNISLSSKPPAASATAAYAQARAGKNEDTKKKIAPSNSNVTVARASEKDKEHDKLWKEAYDSYTKAINDAKKTGFNDAWSEKTRSSLVKMKKMNRTGKGDGSGKGAHWLNKAIYPIDLTITIDGIAGFKFGDVIETSLIPKQYAPWNMVFTITKINHSIKDNMWETTLNTKSRISMDA